MDNIEIKILDSKHVKNLIDLIIERREFVISL